MRLRSPPVRVGNPFTQFGLFSAMLASSVILVLMATVSTSSQPPNSNVERPYETAAELRTFGVVEEIRDVQCGLRSSELSTHLELRTAAGTVHVHLADAAFLRAHQVHVIPGDHIEVLGAQVPDEGRDTLLAHEFITHDGRRFLLRDEQGKSLPE